MWAWPSIDSVDPSHCVFKVWWFLFGSALSTVYTDTDEFGENYVSLNAAPCCFSEAILGEFSWNIGELWDPSAAHLIFNVGSVSGTEQCGWMTRSCSLFNLKVNFTIQWLSQTGLTFDCMQELEKLVMAALCSSGVLAQDMSGEWYVLKHRRKCSWLVKITGIMG